VFSELYNIVICKSDIGVFTAAAILSLSICRRELGRREQYILYTLEPRLSELIGTALSSDIRNLKKKLF
jgi:hypothetical protein